jgi:hypothetical protein
VGRFLQVHSQGWGEATVFSYTITKLDGSEAKFSTSKDESAGQVTHSFQLPPTIPLTKLGLIAL